MKHANGLRWVAALCLLIPAGVCRSQNVEYRPASSGQGEAEATVRSADPEPVQAVRIPGAAMAVLLNQHVPVQYPEEMLGKPAGAVILHAVIGKDGSVEALSVVSGPQPIRAAALDAVKQWRYRPFLLDGEPREVETTILVNFPNER